MNATRFQRSREGWTLVELLVVIAILSLIVGILLPTIGFVRNRAKRIDCQSRLRQIGLAMESYLASDEGRDRYPFAASLPSATPDKPSIADVLKPYAGNSAALFACPVDTEYFGVEGVSYEYRALRFEGKTRAEVLNRLSGQARTSSTEWMMFDFDPFHGAPFQAGSRNVLFADGHVDEF
ncbi:MAG: type II secretion system GspH family protein [Pirellulales bacterium]|nr:type II secretion system GspH family protein [Pirellulales bacterium]